MRAFDAVGEQDGHGGTPPAGELALSTRLEVALSRSNSIDWNRANPRREVLVHVNMDGQGPLHAQLTRALKAALFAGRLGAGGRQLPGEADALDILVRNCVNGTTGQALAPLLAG